MNPNRNRYKQFQWACRTHCIILVVHNGTVSKVLQHRKCYPSLNAEFISSFLEGLHFSNQKLTVRVLPQHSRCSQIDPAFIPPKVIIWFKWCQVCQIMHDFNSCARVLRHENVWYMCDSAKLLTVSLFVLLKEWYKWYIRQCFSEKHDFKLISCYLVCLLEYWMTIEQIRCDYISGQSSSSESSCTK